MRLRPPLHRIPTDAVVLAPGLVDAALSALAGFAVGLYAARFLSGEELGAYALYFGGSAVAALVPTSLIYLPARIAAVDSPRPARITILRQTALWGAVLGAIAALFAAPIGIVVTGDVSTDAILALALTVIPYIVISPMQDHIRAVLYLSNRPTDAATLAAVHLAMTIGSLGALHVADIPAVWIPFTALTIGNVTSSCLGMYQASRSDEPIVQLPSTWSLLRTGKTLLSIAIVNEGSNLAASTTLAALTSAATLGAAEAARIVARPVGVLATGFTRPLSPRLMEAARNRSARQARRVGLLNVSLIAFSTLAVLALFGFHHSLNPLSEFVPLAYETQGLVALTVLAMGSAYVAQVPRPVMMASGQNTALLLITVVSAAMRILTVAVLANEIGAFSMPVALLAVAIVGGSLTVRQTASFFEGSQSAVNQQT